MTEFLGPDLQEDSNANSDNASEVRKDIALSEHHP
jgi:hypothetical protein